MLDKKSLKYIVTALREGYTKDQIEQALINRAFDKEEIDAALDAAIQKVRGREKMQKKFQSFIPPNFRENESRIIEKFSSRMLKKGFHADQIRGVLLARGYDKAKVDQIIPIVEEKAKKDEHIHEFLKEVKVLTRFRTTDQEIRHIHWIKISFVVAALLLGLLSALTSAPSDLVSLAAVAIGVCIALPVGSYVMHHMSLAMHTTEIHFHDAFRYLAIMGLLLFAIKAFFPIEAMLAFLIVVIFFLSNMAIKHYSVPVGKAYIMSSSTIIIAMTVMYATSALVGMLFAFYRIKF